MKVPLSRKRVARIFLVIVSVSLFILVGEYARSNDISTSDLIIFRSLNGLSGNSSVDTIFLVVTELGTPLVWLAITVLASIFFKGRRVRVLVLLGAALIGAELLEAFLKPIYHRERPFTSLDGVTTVGGMASGFSFPSGHALRSFAGSMVLLRFRKSIAYVLLAVSGLVALSRIYLGLHYPSDVLASFLLAYLLAELVIFAQRAHISRDSGKGLSVAPS